MAGMRKEDRIPAEPFQRFLLARIAHWENALSSEGAADRTGARKRVCEELGWPDETGVRKLYRMSHGLRGVGRHSGSRDVPTDYFSRVTVEDALHHAGVAFGDLYPDLVDDDLDPVEGFCVKHEGRVFLDARGECQWCAGEREFAERLARRAREREWATRRKQAA
jgi:hypothetical protein